MLYSATDSENSNREVASLLITLPETFSAAAFFVDRNVLEAGKQIAIESGDEQISYQQLLDRTNRTGNALRQLGVRQEERLFSCSRQS